MNIKYYLKSVEIDERTREYIEKRLEPIEKLFSDVLDKGMRGDTLKFEVEIDLDKKGKFRTELTIKTPYQNYRSEEISESIEGSIDVAVEEIKIQISKNNDKRNTLMRKGARLFRKMVSLGKR